MATELLLLPGLTAGERRRDEKAARMVGRAYILYRLYGFNAGFVLMLRAGLDQATARRVLGCKRDRRRRAQR